jgi:alanyl-tRNA synthetase
LTLLEELMAEVKAQGQTVLPGDAAFRLWDTYGFPLDLTRDIAAENGLQIDMPGYRAALEQQRQRARAAAQFGGAGEGKDLSVYASVLDKLPAGGVEHLYLLAGEAETTVVAILADGALVSQAQQGQQVEIVLAATPFYVESGGQVSDTGVIRSAAGASLGDRWEVMVGDTRRPVAGVIVHSGQGVHGVVTEGAPAVAEVDMARRWDIMRNHTATHLLHAELRRVLGGHVRQAGSLVAPDRLRFDFTHPGTLSPQEIAAIEQGVNNWIYRNDPVTWRWMAYKDAVATGAMALFGEKYGDEVRVVEIGAPSAGFASRSPLPVFSRELCGGSHVNNTGEIGVFHIGSEGSVGSGVRRVEAVTGRGAHALLQERLDLLHRTASALGVPETEVDRKAQALVEQVSSQQKELARLREDLARQEFKALLAQVVELEGGVKVLAQQVAAADANVMRQMTDWFRNQLGSGVVVLGAGIDGKPQLVAAVTDDLVARGVHAGRLVQAVAKELGGGGGGRPNLAQAGGVDLGGLPAALADVPGLVAAQLR